LRCRELGLRNDRSIAKTVLGGSRGMASGTWAAVCATVATGTENMDLAPYAGYSRCSVQAQEAARSEDLQGHGQSAFRHCDANSPVVRVLFASTHKEGVGKGWHIEQPWKDVMVSSQGMLLRPGARPCKVRATGRNFGPMLIVVGADQDGSASGQEDARMWPGMHTTQQAILLLLPRCISNRRRASSRDIGITTTAALRRCLLKPGWECISPGCVREASQSSATRSLRRAPR
jgi:hypothetical protein